MHIVVYADLVLFFFCDFVKDNYFFFFLVDCLVNKMFVLKKLERIIESRIHWLIFLI